MRRLTRWYGAGPLHLLTLVGCLALGGYAAARLLPGNPVGIVIWLAGAVIGHDLLLFPLYTLADRSVLAVVRHRGPRQPIAGPWINYVRVPVVLAGILLLIWFPLIFRLPARFPHTTTLPLGPYFWHWLAVTGALFLLSAAALAVRLRLGPSRAAAAEAAAGADQDAASTGAAGGPGECGQDDLASADEASHGAPGLVRHPGAQTPTERQGLPSAPAVPVPASDRSHDMSGPFTIAERVQQMHATTAGQPPSEAAGAFARERAELAASGPAGIAPAGTLVPDAPLLAADGTPATLYATAGDGLAVLVFYRGAWCPYCNIALSAYQEQLLPELTRRGIALIAISPQQPDGSLTMREKHQLAFPVVSDPGNAIAGHLGIVTQPAPAARAAQLRLGLDLASVNIDGTPGLPLPATVILDAGRTVRWIDVHPDYSTRTEPAEVIDALDRLS
ncbi:MAG TPA: peroxiredoxin-like family protein [Trebonia sp.]|jgi:peroxiredoxin|nr:peroxiredoxin-like family protein [Trebonia sp.]